MTFLAPALLFALPLAVWLIVCPHKIIATAECHRVKLHKKHDAVLAKSLLVRVTKKTRR